MPWRRPEVLFYFTLAAAVFDLERDAVAKKISGFDAAIVRIPALSVFAIEEPGNQLSPYYLARIVKKVRSVIKGDNARAIVTSHAPAVLSRVAPEEVRYCRCDDTTRETSVQGVELPKDEEEAVKFVRGAMLAYPELYFARFVLLVEGDSERVVLPRLAQQKDCFSILRSWRSYRWVDGTCNTFGACSMASTFLSQPCLTLTLGGTEVVAMVASKSQLDTYLIAGSRERACSRSRTKP